MRGIPRKDAKNAKKDIKPVGFGKLNHYQIVSWLTNAHRAVNNCSLRTMYRRPKFLEILLEIRREMALEADYDVDLFAENARSGIHSAQNRKSDSPTDLTSANGHAEDAELRTARGQIRKK